MSLEHLAAKAKVTVTAVRKALPCLEKDERHLLEKLFVPNGVGRRLSVREVAAFEDQPLGVVQARRDLAIANLAALARQSG